MKANLIGNKNIFAIGYAFLEDGDTEITMFIEGKNILEFTNGGILRTTRWNLDELTMWLREFVDNLQEDPYPVEVEGRYAADKDDNARDFDSEDEEEFDAYYDKLWDWCHMHKWHSASSGAILADLYFQLVSDKVEISWDNRSDEAEFTYLRGGTSIDKNLFVDVINKFLNAYADHWFNNKAQ